MADPNWGMLNKSQIDDTKIDQEILDFIDFHNDDPDAHVEAGQSLQSHKAAEIIDHLARSIVDDKIKEGEITLKRLSNLEYQIYTCFESLTGWSYGGPAMGGGFFDRQLITGSIINTVCVLNTRVETDENWHDWTKDIFFQTAIVFDHNVNQEAWVGAFNDQEAENDTGFGFKILNGDIYVTILYGDGDTRQEKSTLIQSFSPLDNLILRANFVASESKIYFYINGILKYTEEAQMPVLPTSHFFRYYFKNTSASDRELFLRYLNYSRQL